MLLNGEVAEVLCHGTKVGLHVAYRIKHFALIDLIFYVNKIEFWWLLAQPFS
jgi:hypothetical protein